MHTLKKKIYKKEKELIITMKTSLLTSVRGIYFYHKYYTVEMIGGVSDITTHHGE